MTPSSARLAGALYLVTFVTSIPAYALKSATLADPAAADAAAVSWSALLEVILAIACVGTAVVLFPIIRRQSEVAALGFVAARTVESALIAVGIIAVLGAAHLGSAPGTAALVAVHDGAFLLGPGFVPAVNAACLGWVLLRSGLMPRALPLIGLIGAPMLALSATGTLFGLFAQDSPTAAVLALPIAAWELGLGLWLLVKGFDAKALTRLVGVGTASAAT